MQLTKPISEIRKLHETRGHSEHLYTLRVNNDIPMFCKMQSENCVPMIPNMNYDFRDCKMRNCFPKTNFMA